MAKVFEFFNRAPHGKNIVGVQTSLSPTDYFSENSFYSALHLYLEKCAALNWLSPNTVVVFPEYIGSWLISAHSKAAMECSSIASAMVALALASPLKTLSSSFQNKHEDKIISSLFIAQAEKIASIYNDVFSKLSKNFQVTIVAGSVLLPSPRVEKGRIVAGQGQLVNASFLFRPNGLVDDSVVFKRSLIHQEASFTASKNCPLVYETPIGKLAVLICADSWYEDNYLSLEKFSPDVVVVPALVHGKNAMSQPWPGLNGFQPDEPIDKNDVKNISEQDAWLKYSLPGKLKLCGAKAGMTVIGRDVLWDLETDGGTLVVRGDEAFVAGGDGGASLTCQWLA